MLQNTQMWLNYTYSGKSGYAEVPEDGGEASNSRYLTFRGLTRALQIELGGLTVDGDFGDGTAARFDAVYPSGYGQISGEHNMSYIIQGACWTKGQYNPGGFDGQFGPNTENAIKEFQADAGISQTGKVDGYILQGLMNTDDYSYSGSSTSDEGYKHQVQMMLNERYYTQIGLTAPNGLWERKSHRNLIKACQIEWSITVDGIFGNDAYNAAPTLSINTSGWTNSKRLLQAALAVNGFWPGGLTGTFGSGTQSAVTQFQSFVCLGADGIAGKNTWASLLKSSGYSGRTATACDTATQLSLSQAQALKAAGYDTVGRYLTKVAGGIDKNLTANEISNLSTAGMKVFPIYQTYGNKVNYFTRSQGIYASIQAKSAAKDLGFPSSTVIYFAVDYDVLTAEIESNIIPYFQGIQFNMDGAFKIGVYAPRAVCVALSEAGLTEKSFVADMSSGFTGNIGVKMPDNWAYDQFAEITQSGIGIDKCIASPRATAILASQLTPQTEEPIENDFTILGLLHNAAIEYLQNEKNISSPSVNDVNTLVMDFFRQDKYFQGFWPQVAGGIDVDWCNWVNTEKGIYLLYEPGREYVASRILRDPITGSLLDIEHTIATLAAMLYDGWWDEEADHLAGWAGDLIQLGNVLHDTKENLNEDYWNIVGRLVGAQPEDCVRTLPNDFPRLIPFYDENEEDHCAYGPEATGFSYNDFVADVDAYCLYKNYNFNTSPIYSIFDEYYDPNGAYQNRFTNFKNYLCADKDSNDVADIAYQFTKGGTLLTSQFPIKYNTTDYATTLANAFADKLDSFIGD